MLWQGLVHGIPTCKAIGALLIVPSSTPAATSPQYMYRAPIVVYFFVSKSATVAAHIPHLCCSCWSA